MCAVYHGAKYNTLRVWMQLRYKGTGDRGQGTWYRGQGTGDRGQGTGNRCQGTQNRGQGTGDRRQETGDRRQETGDRRQENPFTVVASLSALGQAKQSSKTICKKHAPIFII